MDINRLPEFSSLDEASKYLKQHGRLEYFGRTGGWDDAYYVHTFYSNDGRTYHLDIFKNGKVTTRR